MPQRLRQALRLLGFFEKKQPVVEIMELPERLQEDETFVNAARNSDRETAQQQFNNSMLNIVVQMMSEDTEFCRNYLDNPDFMSFINQRVFQNAYDRVMSAG